MKYQETTDLTEFERDEEARFWLAAIIESSDDAIIGMTLDGLVISWNQAAQNLYGYSAKEAVGQPLSVLVPPEGHDEIPALLEKVTQGESVDYYETVKMAKDGRRIDVSLTMSPIKNSGRNVIGTSIIARDITQRMRAEAELSRLNEELNARNRELAHKNAEVEAFVYGVSHDLRSPLVNLEGFSEELALVAQDLREMLQSSDMPEEIKQRGLAMVDDDMATSIHFIHGAVGRLSGIIDALLGLSRVGRIEYRWQEVNLDRAVGRVVDAMQGTIDEREAIVVVDDLPPAWGDPTALEQVFANLLGNALKYLKSGRAGVVKIGSEKPNSTGRDDDTPKSRTYYVKDNGAGIPERALDKVFEPFQRVHPELASGQGMGLTLVQRIVERHGGEMWVESTEGEGSTFFVRLPSEKDERR